MVAINRQIDLLPLPQEKRSIHAVLDDVTIRVLKLANASPAYFIADDLAFGEITSTQASASLRVLTPRTSPRGGQNRTLLQSALRHHRNAQPSTKTDEAVCAAPVYTREDAYEE